MIATEAAQSVEFVTTDPQTQESAKANSRERDWMIPFAILTLSEVATAFLLATWLEFESPPIASAVIIATLIYSTVGIVWLFIALGKMATNGVASPIRALLSAMREYRSRMLTVFLSLQLIAVQLTTLTSLKSMLTLVAPFWADQSLAQLDAILFFGDPWRLTHAVFGWATEAIDWGYSLWIPLKFLTLLGIVLMPVSRLKSQAMLSYILVWTILGIVGAYLLSSAGPIYFQQITGEARFAPLVGGLQQNDALAAPMTAQYLWAEFSSGDLGFGTGISAMPSMHVAIATWTALISLRLGKLPGAFGLFYLALICVGSVHLAWHYAIDGIVSLLATVGLWKMAGMYLSRVERSGYR